nr:MAG TPA: Helix-turn-helix XRE-family like protein [Caudoviricetes sp.]
MKEAIATELKLLRYKNNFTLNDVAKEFDVVPYTISRWEKDTSGLSIENLEKMLILYKTDINIFFRNVCEYIHNNIEKE